MSISATFLDQFTHRSGKTHQTVYRVIFDAPTRPEIFLSAANGAIIEVQDDVRCFHFQIMRLHQLNFFGFKKTLTIIPGSAVLLRHLWTCAQPPRPAADRTGHSTCRRGRDLDLRGKLRRPRLHHTVATPKNAT